MSSPRRPEPHRRRALAVPAFAVTLSLLLVACGGSDGDDGGGGGGGGDDDLTWEDSPLAEYFTPAMGEEADPEEMQAQAEEQNARVEQLVAECMAAEGFEYTPVVMDGSFSFEVDEGEDPVERARQQGYGFFTWDQGAPEEEFVDPNAELVEAMSESEQEAYYETLHGAPPEVEESAEEMSTEYDWEQAGCYGESQHQVYDVESEYEALNAVYSDPRWTELMDQMNTVYTDAMEAPELVELNTAWADCMAEAGHPDLANPQAAMDSVMELQNSQWEEHADDPEYTGPEGEELEALKEQEIELAVADYTCQEDVDYVDGQLRVQFEIEQQFIDENLAELEAFAEALAQAAP